MQSNKFLNLLGVLIVVTFVGNDQLLQLSPKIIEPSERVDGRFSPAISRRKKQPVKTISEISFSVKAGTFRWKNLPRFIRRHGLGLVCCREYLEIG